MKKRIDEAEQAANIVSAFICLFQDKYRTKAEQVAHLDELIEMVDAHSNPLVNAAAPRLAREYQPMTMKDAADMHGVAQAQKLLDLFENAKGRPARTMGELKDWLGSPEGQALSFYI